MREIADFLEIDVPAERWPAIVEHCGFDYMKHHAAAAQSLGGAICWLLLDPTTPLEEQVKD